MKHVSIIGGSGFIGARLTALLADDAHYSVSVIDKDASHDFPALWAGADVRQVDELLNVVPVGSLIVNLAAEHRDDVTPLNLYEEVNVGGAKNICAVAVEKKVQTIVFTSSVAVYGFAPLETDEFGDIQPFNEYGRTKYLAEQHFVDWQADAPHERSLVILRPTVVFGEGNRGNVHNLMKQIASKKFIMIGSGRNRKSIAYVGNVAAFLKWSLNLGPGLHTFNYVDKPDFSMNDFVRHVRTALHYPPEIRVRAPKSIGMAVGMFFDLFSRLTGMKFPISKIRITKFCANSVYATAVDDTNFTRPFSLEEALKSTVQHEFDR
jgi:nucleoside-diphosphate-sugar epimerase